MSAVHLVSSENVGAFCITERAQMTTSPKDTLHRLPQEILNQGVMLFLSGIDCWNTRAVYSLSSLDSEERTAIREDPIYWKMHFQERFTQKEKLLPPNNIHTEVCRLSVRFFGDKSPYIENKESIPFIGTLTFVAKSGYEKAVEKLIEVVTPEIDLALVGACEGGHSTIVTMLLNAGANKDVRLPDGRTPLHCAAEKGNTDVMELLLKTDADTELEDLEYRTPLNLAAEEDHIDIVKLLVEAGANKEKENGDGVRPFHHALSSGNLSTVVLLWDAGVDRNIRDDIGRTSLHHAVKGGHPEIVQMLLTDGADIHAVDNTGRTPFCNALLSGNLNSCRLLWEPGVLDIHLIDGWGQTYLHHAAKGGHPEVMRMLLSDRSNRDRLDDVDNLGMTPLHWAAMHRNDKVVKLLLEAGSDIHAVDDRGNTPLHWARGIRIAEMLLDAGAQTDINTENVDGRTPADLSAKYFPEVLNTLLEVPRSQDAIELKDSQQTIGMVGSLSLFIDNIVNSFTRAFLELIEVPSYYA